MISKVFGFLYCHVFFVCFGRWLPGPSALKAGVFIFFRDTTKPSGRDGF